MICGLFHNFPHLSPRWGIFFDGIPPYFSLARCALAAANAHDRAKDHPAHLRKNSKLVNKIQNFLHNFASC